MTQRWFPNDLMDAQIAVIQISWYTSRDFNYYVRIKQMKIRHGDEACRMRVEEQLPARRQVIAETSCQTINEAH